MVDMTCRGLQSQEGYEGEEGGGCGGGGLHLGCFFVFLMIKTCGSVEVTVVHNSHL